MRPNGRLSVSRIDRTDTRSSEEPASCQAPEIKKLHAQRAMSTNNAAMLSHRSTVQGTANLPPDFLVSCHQFQVCPEHSPLDFWRRWSIIAPDTSVPTTNWPEAK
jgi:hypothetical protein